MSVLWYRSKETLEDLSQAAASSADGFILVEAARSKRRQTKAGDWLEMAKLPPEVASRLCFTLALVQASSELGELKRYVENAVSFD